MEEGVEVILEQGTVGETHLIHVSVDMKKFHGGGASTDFIELSVLMFSEQFRLGVPDGLLVNVVLAWFTMAVGGLGGVEDRKG